MMKIISFLALFFAVAHAFDIRPTPSRRGFLTKGMEAIAGAAFISAGSVALTTKEAVAAGGTARADDNEESLRIRLMEYYKKTSPLIGYYYAKGNLSAVDGLASIDEVEGSIAAILN